MRFYVNMDGLGSASGASTGHTGGWVGGNRVFFVQRRPAPPRVSKAEKERKRQELKKEYRKAAMKYHPDRQGGSEEMMKKLNGRYQELLKQIDNL